ncbi:hypothetical protein RHMOL_Rhmol11G0059400 [Rhododendron molle]|uniref:Uncharacterized protein n=1 Tax=Rhododendron molle TaxID=49168 RepID=A0ACC0LPG1_RHOML|nr:hypothetical protein RHMOL_Rhmol11G0059400 [Rhododendron molle]
MTSASTLSSSSTSKTVEVTSTNKSAMASSSSSFPNAHHFLSLKLTHTNYLFWKTQITPYLRGQHLLGYADGTYPCPPKSISVDGASIENPSFQTWFDQDQLLMSLLISILTEDVIPLIVGTTTSWEIWTTLESTLASPSNTRILQLHLHLQNIKQGELFVTQYLQKAKGFFDELNAAGRPISLQDFNLYIFKGLNSTFQNLIPIPTLANCPSLPYSELHSMLLSHELMHSIGFASLSVSDSTEPSPQANFVQCNASSNGGYRGRDPNGRGGNQGYRPNDSCGDARPFSHESRSYHSHDSHQRCQICNGTNHIALSCNQRYNHTAPPAAHLASYNSALAHFANRLPDTGATHHATPDLMVLSHHENYLGTDHLQVTKKTLLRGATKSGLYKVSTSTPIHPSAHLSEKLLASVLASNGPDHPMALVFFIFGL